MQPVVWRIEHYPSLDSSQDELRRRLDAGADIHGLAVRVDVQTAGRGQRARDWSSAAGGSWQSAALRGNAHPASPLFIALGLAGTLRQLPGAAGLRLKWPNDLLLQGRKFGGVLCEASRGYLLIGVGINVRNEPPPDATRLGEAEPGQVHSLVLDGITAGWRLMREQPGLLPEAWAEYDALYGQKLQLERAGVQLSGTARGVDLSGRLKLRTAEGELLLDSAAGLRRTA